MYNSQQIEPLLSAQQMARFESCWQWFNMVIYPLAVILFLIPIIQLRPIHRDLIDGRSVSEDVLKTSQRKVVNLPWWFLAVASVGWLICIPVFPLALASLDEPLSSNVVVHLTTSFLIASLIAVTHSFFAVELVIQQTLFPVFFQTGTPANVPGTAPMTISQRGLMWSASAVVSPVLSLVLLILVPDATESAPAFALVVAAVAVSFGMATSLLLGRLVATPVLELKRASLAVAEGDFSAQIKTLRADEFGMLINQFNSMITGLAERERLQATFGRHVGREAAKQILAAQDGVDYKSASGTLGGTKQLISVMFADVRNFTAQSADAPVDDVIAGLNLMFGEAVKIVEKHDGMINKFLGDGFMAIFGSGGVPSSDRQHADAAVEAGCELLARIDALKEDFEKLGWSQMKIGVGINTGIAMVGSIGAPERHEYTAMGDTVNVAARVEALTKSTGYDLLITGTTYDALSTAKNFVELPRQNVKGKSTSLQIYGAVNCD
ncbi:adenylate/guanylate cyclase domain-containing protein [Roseimaritima multifibrata]|uniref:adenylate/guanylate cyclase domain-containing protein n=1 Tax=Roseimaritima multifibrata TaxID=1930274 RepID=UPI001FE41B4A|nr:adenylate/guanylate cyclase domain-containing protein [Roseimaritima multifibrata]